MVDKTFNILYTNPAIYDAETAIFLANYTHKKSITVELNLQPLTDFSKNLMIQYGLL